MDLDKFMDWQNTNWDELTNGFAQEKCIEFHEYCERNWKDLEAQMEDLKE